MSDNTTPEERRMIRRKQSVRMANLRRGIES